MKALFTKLYFLVMGPIYRKVSRDCVLHMQELKRAQAEFQERFTARVCDQLVAASLVGSNSTTPAPASLERYSDDEVIHYVIDLINKSEDLVVLSKKNNVPLRDLAEMYSRYGGMSPIAIRKLRALEKQTAAEQPSVSARQTIDVTPRKAPTSRNPM